MPDLGEGLEEGEIVEWLVAEDDTVALNQPLVEVETAKATVEIPSPFAGVVATLHAVVGSAVTGGVAVGDVRWCRRPSRLRGGSARATPPVRKLAKELGVDLATVEGSGAGGRITADDVRLAADDSAPDDHALAVADRDRGEPRAAGSDPAGHDVPHRGLLVARVVPRRARGVAASDRGRCAVPHGRGSTRSLNARMARRPHRPADRGARGTGCRHRAWTGGAGAARRQCERHRRARRRDQAPR